MNYSSLLFPRPWDALERLSSPLGPLAMSLLHRMTPRHHRRLCILIALSCSPETCFNPPLSTAHTKPRLKYSDTATKQHSNTAPQQHSSTTSSRTIFVAVSSLKPKHSLTALRTRSQCLPSPPCRLARAHHQIGRCLLYRSTSPPGPTPQFANLINHHVLIVEFGASTVSTAEDGFAAAAFNAAGPTAVFLSKRARLRIPPSSYEISRPHSR